MTNNRSVLIISAIALIMLALVPAVSAEVLYDEHIEYYVFTGGNGTGNPAGAPLATTGYYRNLYIPDITKVSDLSYVVVEFPATTLHPEGVQELTYTIDGKTKTARMHTSYIRNILQQHIKTRYTFFFDDWDNVDMVGSRTITTPALYSAWRQYNEQTRTGDSPIWVGGGTEASYTIVASTGIYFKNDIKISSLDAGNTIAVEIKRNIYNQIFPSTIVAYNNDTEVFRSYGIIDDDLRFLSRDVTTIKLETPGDNVFSYPITATIDEPDAIPVDIYVRNSQTGNLLAGSHIIISASVGGEFHEVVNQTLPGGTATYTLQPTGGSLPNPDYYRLIATADGYNPYMPYIDFELDRPTNLIVMMEPITGGPVDENKTFIEFYVRDLSGNGISDASVTCGGYTLITNSAGYTQFEMPKNAIYPYTVRKSGYVTIEGTATVADGPRYTVNVVLGPKEIPTYTPDPGETPGGPGATPTPDRRTNEEKGQAVIDMIADNAEGIGALALICLLMGLLKLMAKW